jgi:hypothetical protein
VDHGKALEVRDVEADVLPGDWRIEVMGHIVLFLITKWINLGPFLALTMGHKSPDPAFTIPEGRKGL